VDGSTRCALGEAEPRRLAKVRRGSGDTLERRLGRHTGSPRIVRRRLRRAVIVAPKHGELTVGRRNQPQPTMFFAVHATFLVYSARHRPPRRRVHPGISRWSANLRCAEGGTNSARHASPMA